MRLQAVEQGNGIVAAVGHADRGATDQKLVLARYHEARQAAPKQGNRCSGAVVAMDAGAANFNH